MAGGGVDRLALACGGSEAQAVVRRAQVRAALDDPARYPLVGRRPAARLFALARREGVARPLPDVAGHVIQAVAVGWEGTDRRRAGVAVEHEILPGELALPAVGQHLPARRELVTPCEGLAVEPPARGVLPLGLGRQRLARPRRVRRGVLVGDLRDRVAAARVRVAPRPLRPLPR